jgi:polyhydroxyalkanoate synthase
VLLVPSLINRWYVLDLRRGSSLVEALLAAGHDVYCLDWGAPEDEDRWLEWDDVVARLARAIRIVRRTCEARSVSVLGYCMGGTLAGIAAALEPGVAALVNLAGPFDFAEAGVLRTMVDARWFDARAIGAAGNISALQMQSGFMAMRPTLQIAKWVGVFDQMHDERAWDAFEALETWANDNVAFPGAAYATYIAELYQQNLLVQGRHHVRGRRVDLGSISCPVLTVVAERDTICPPRSARALHDRAGTSTTAGPHACCEVLAVPGGHVGAVVGRRAQGVLYPAIARWLHEAPAA